MKTTNGRTPGTVRERYTLVNRSRVSNLAKIIILCLLSKNINMNTKTEIKPI